MINNLNKNNLNTATAASNGILTKNLVISILAGISIVGGAFWLRIGNPSSSSSAGNDQVVATINQTDSTDSPASTATDPSIKIADLPNVNNQPGTTDRLIQTEDPNTLSYDELNNKNLLYSESAVKYSTKNLSSKVPTNRASLLSYGINLVKLLSNYPFYTKLSPTEITFNIYSNKDTKNTGLPAQAGLTELDAIRLAYESASKNLLTMSVPLGLTDLHIKLTNSFDRAAQLVGNMEQIKTDKLLALNSARQFVEEQKYVIGILEQISIYLQNKNIDLGKENKLDLRVTVIK